MSLPKRLRRHLCFLDVGHGNSTVIIAGENSITVVDVGRQNAFSEFLMEQEITHIHSIYLSHADADHIGALTGILATKQISIDSVYVNSDFPKDSKTWDDLLYELDLAHEAGELKLTIGLVSGHSEKLSGDVSLRVLGPSRYLASKGPGSANRDGARIHSNSISAIIAISVGTSRIALLPGDVDGIGLSDLFRRPQNLRSSILVYPHHGGVPGAGTTPQEQRKQLLLAVNPNLVIFSIGRGIHAMPNPDTVRQLRRLLPETRIVCTQLSKHCADQLRPVEAVHLPQVHAQGLEHGTCCGGTIVVPLDDVSAIQPQKAPHVEFIQTHAPTSLCFGHRPEAPDT